MQSITYSNLMLRPNYQEDMKRSFKHLHKAGFIVAKSAAQAQPIHIVRLPKFCVVEAGRGGVSLTRFCTSSSFVGQRSRKRVLGLLNLRDGAKAAIALIPDLHSSES